MVISKSILGSKPKRILAFLFVSEANVVPLRELKKNNLSIA
jgi:hypothetical protein